MRFAAVAAAGFTLLIVPACAAASKKTSWEIGKVLGADRKQELVGTAEHSSTYGPASHSTTSPLYNAYEEYTIESDKFVYITRERLRSGQSKPALSVTAASVALNVSRPALSSLLNGKAGLSGDMALRIEKAFGMKMETLMRMQSAYDIAQSRKREKEIRVRRCSLTKRGNFRLNNADSLKSAGLCPIGYWVQKQDP